MVRYVWEFWLLAGDVDVDGEVTRWFEDLDSSDREDRTWRSQMPVRIVMLGLKVTPKAVLTVYALMNFIEAAVHKSFPEERHTPL